MRENVLAGTPEKTVRHICDGLQSLVADLFVAASHVKEAHWRVRGPYFTPFHGLLDDIHSHLQEGQDVLAERIQQLGGEATGCAHSLVRQATLTPLGSDGAFLNMVRQDLTIVLQKIRTVITDIEPLNDPVTIDICTGVLRSLDKDWWMIDASLD